MSLYELDFSSSEWDEIEALFFEPFNPGTHQALTRAQWTAVGHMALGKAQRIKLGEYGSPISGTSAENRKWVDTLAGIAGTIFSYFRPGDMKI